MIRSVGSNAVRGSGLYALSDGHRLNKECGQLVAAKNSRLVGLLGLSIGGGQHADRQEVDFTVKNAEALLAGGQAPMESGRMPLVSVVIPAYNSAHFISDAIRTVLNQTYRYYEVIVIDDGSSDETAEILKSFAGQIRYMHQGNRGAAAARNAGIKIATGDYICFLDADDLWNPAKLERQVGFMAAHGEVALLFTDAEEWEGDEIQKASVLAGSMFQAQLLTAAPIRDAFGKLVVQNFIPTSSVMIRRECLMRAGLFDEDLPNAEDRDLWLRVAADCEIACLPLVLAVWRGHGSNISKRTELALRSRIRMWERNRSRFPELATTATYQRLFAVTYLELGYILLAKGEGREARRWGVASLRNALEYVVATRSTPHYRWLLSMALIPLSFVWWPLVRFVWQGRNRLLGRSSVGRGDGSSDEGFLQVRGVPGR